MVAKLDITLSEYHGEALQIAASPQNCYCSVEQHIFGHKNIIKMVTIKTVDEPLT